MGALKHCEIICFPSHEETEHSFFPNNELIIFNSFKFCVKVDMGNMQQEYFLSGFSDWWISE